MIDRGTNRNRTRRRSALLACALPLLFLAGCNNPGWVPNEAPAAGVELVFGQVNLRNLVLVTDEQGEAVLFGAGSSTGDDRLIGLVVVPINANNEAQAPKSVPQDLPFKANDLTQTNLLITDPALQAGLTAQVTFIFSSSGNDTVTVPILPSDHPDFSAAYASATAEA